MRIAIDVSQSIYDTGVSKYTKNLVTHLLRADQDDEFTLFGGSLRRKKELDSWIKRAGGSSQRHTFFLSPWFFHLAWNTFHLLPAELFTGKVDLIHTSDWAEPPAKTPKVSTVHDLNFLIDPEYSHPQMHSVQTKRLYWVKKEAAGIIAVSKATKKDLVERLEIEPERIDVIYEGPSIQYEPVVTDEEASAVKIKFGINRPYLVIPGAGHPRKNIANAIKAFALTRLDLQLVILGRATMAEKQAGNKQTIYTGFVSDREWEILVSGAQALFYPSLYEGFGLPVLDAFVCGVPVVTSNISSLPEVAGEAAILVDPLSIEEMAGGIIKALDDPGPLVKAGRERASKFSWKKTAEETIQFYQKFSQKG